jgi:hypothetical protein
VNNDSIRSQSKPIMSTALLAGFAGGVAEMVWVAGYCAVTPLSSSEVLRQISLSVGLNTGNGALASLAGVAIHLGLSVLVGLAFTLAVWRPPVRRAGIASTWLVSCTVLALIWACNFFLVLPSLNPGFADLMPYAVTLASKLLFGIAMGWVLYRGVHQDQRSTAPALCAV